MHAFAWVTMASPVWAITIYVPEDFRSIGFALWYAEDGDEIIVGPGVYTDTGENIIDLEGKSVWVHSSDGPEVTIIDGENQRRGVLFQSGEGSGSIIEGFTFRDCQAPWYDWNGNGQVDAWENFGGGIWCRDGSSPTIRNCHFVNGVAEYGAGICNFDESYSANEPTIENCLFHDNDAGAGVGGAVYSYASSPPLIGCQFIGNSASYGGAILNVQGSDSTITNCVFYANVATADGGAIYNDSSGPLVTGCEFNLNSAQDDGGAVFNADPSSSQNVPVFEDCSFTSNVAADEGGGIHNFSASPSMIGCTITGNQAGAGGGIYSWNGSLPVLSYTIVCGNTPTQIMGTWSDEGDNDVSAICGVECPDATGDGVVDVNDILAIIGAYETDDPNADVDGSGLVDANDILAVLAGWGLCP